MTKERRVIHYGMAEKGGAPAQGRDRRSGLASSPLEDLMVDLAGWAPPMDPGTERILGNRILMACGWSVDENRIWSPYLNESLRFADGHHPHPLMRIDDALAIYPPGWMVVEMRLLNHPRLWMATAVHVTRGQRLAPMHVCLSIAVASGAVLAWAEEVHRA